VSIFIVYLSLAIIFNRIFQYGDYTQQRALPFAIDDAYLLVL